jgi:hypothetical protein
MALQLSITAPNGVTMQYHKIFYVSAKLTPDDLQATVSVASYCCNTERATEKATGGEGSLRIQLADYDCADLLKTTPTLTIAAIYEYLKTLPEFAGAVDC